MGAIWKLLSLIIKEIGKSILSSLPPEVQQTASLWGRIKNPFSIKKAGGDKPSGIGQWLMNLLKQVFFSVLKAIGNFIIAFSDVILVALSVLVVGMILHALMSAFGAFNGRIVVDFDKFEELNSDESIYMDAQNTNELKKAYMQLVSETSYYQMFNLRDLNPEGMSTYTKVMAKITNKLFSWGWVDHEMQIEDMNYHNMSRRILGWVPQDERYIYSDANKNALKYMKLPKVLSLGTDNTVGSVMNEVNDNFRDYYNRETTFQLSETLLSEMNRILFGEFSNADSITYPEAFVKPVAFVSDFYRIQETGRPENIGLPYVYMTQRVTLEDIKNSSSMYYNKPWLEGIIKSQPSHIVYDYAVEQKNMYYWSDTDNDLAKQMAWGNVGKYVTVGEELEYEDATTVEKQVGLKLYWKVKDKDLDGSVENLENGNNPYNEHMGASITKGTYADYFDGPYTKLTKEADGTLRLSNIICTGDTGIVYVEPETGNSSSTYRDGYVKIRCEYNKYPVRHMQLVSIYDENGYMQVNSRVLFNKTFVQKKSVRDSYRYFPEYFSGFENFVTTDLERLPKDVWNDWINDQLGAGSFLESEIAKDSVSADYKGGEYGDSCDDAEFAADMKKPYGERQCSIIRRYAGTNGLAFMRAKFKEWGTGISNFFTGGSEEAEINVSAEAMYYLLLAYDDYIIETGEYGVAWDYKYYTSTVLDLEYQKAQYKDIFGFREVFVDWWDDTGVYKDTLDDIKALDSMRSVSTTYVPTSIISGQKALYESSKDTENNNNNRTGYGWKIANIDNSTAQNISSDFKQPLERVKGEASLEAPQYSSGNLITILTDYIGNSIHYGESDFRYYFDTDGKLKDSGDKSWETYIEDLDKKADDDGVTAEDEDGNKISIVEALKSYNEGGDWRNTTEAWDKSAMIYRPADSFNIQTKITSVMDDYPNAGRVSYKTRQGDYLPYETKSVRDYGLGSVLSYIQDIRVVYQSGLFMDETYVGKDKFVDAFESIINNSTLTSKFGKAGRGYYPKELLDMYPQLLEALRTTPIPLEDLASLATDILSLQYTATDYEMDLAEEKTSSNNYDDIRNTLVKIISARNVNGLYVGPLVSVGENDMGFQISNFDNLNMGNEDKNSIKNIVGSNGGTDVCQSAYDKCTGYDEDEVEELRACLVQAQSSGYYFNEGLFDCERRCNKEADTSIKDIHPSLGNAENEGQEGNEGYDNEVTRIEEKRSKCLDVCAQSWPEISLTCKYSGDGEGISGVYGYSPYLKDSFWNNVADALIGWFTSTAREYNQTQFLDPLQYYIEWFDFKADEEEDAENEDFFEKFLKLKDNTEDEDNSRMVTRMWAAASKALKGIEGGTQGFSTLNVGEHFIKRDDFGNAGTYIVGEFREDFYNQYRQDLEPMNMIMENESYRVYMIDEAVTFLGTFTYTYKNDIVNIGSTATRQITGLAYADRYYYMSNYIFAIPRVRYEAQVYDSDLSLISHYYDTKSEAMSKCEYRTIKEAQDFLTNQDKKWWNPFTWFDEPVDVIDTDTICKTVSTCVQRESCREYVKDSEGKSTGRCAHTRSCLDYDYAPYWYHVASYPVEDSFNAATTNITTFTNDQVYILDTPDEISKLTETINDEVLEDKININIKVYDSISDNAFSVVTNESTDFKTDYVHDYTDNYINQVAYTGDNMNHYGKRDKVYDNLKNREGYKTITVNEDGSEIPTDSLGLPDDLHMNIDINENGTNLVSAQQLTKEDMNKVLAAATTMCNEEGDCTPKEQWVNIYDEYGYFLGVKYMKVGGALIQNSDSIGVGALVVNREDFGLPIPLFRHFAGVIREILPRQRGYYFNGEVFDSWHSRLILSDETTPAQKEAIFQEKNETQSYIYDYIMNFETYVPMDVKSDYDLMSRAREAYHSVMSNEVSHTTATTMLSNDIYNIVNSEAWKETISKFSNTLDTTTAAQLISGLLEVSVERAPQKMISILNQNITEDDKKISDGPANISRIQNAIKANISGGSTSINAPAGTTNLNNTLFIGDSLTDGMKKDGLFNGTGAVVDAEVGRNLSQANTAASGHSNYGTVFINIGMNDAENADSTFETRYRTLINTVKSKNPGATIYLGTIPGINEIKAHASGYTVTNADINAKNIIIKKLANEYSLKQMDVNYHLGTIGSSDTSDGIHLASNKNTQWFELISTTVNTTGAVLMSKLDVSLELVDGSFETYRLTDVGPGMIFYNFNPAGVGLNPVPTVLETDDIAPGQIAGAGTTYVHEFSNVTITINDSVDERLDRHKALEFVATKFGRLVRATGDVRLAILAYFHGEEYTRIMNLEADSQGWGASWINDDDPQKIAAGLSKILSNAGKTDEAAAILRDYEDIDTFMYSGKVVEKVMSYIQSTNDRGVLNSASTIPAAATGLDLGAKKDQSMDFYNKYKYYLDKYCAEYQVDVALAAAIFTHESHGIGLAGICSKDNTSTYVSGTRPACDGSFILYTGPYSYNGGGGPMQIHHFCDGGGDLDGGGSCTRTITSDLTGKVVTINMKNPRGVVNSAADISSYLNYDDRYGDFEKSFEWAIIFISNLLQRSNNDGLQAAARYNGWPSCDGDDPNWYTCYSNIRGAKNYVWYISQYYNEELATATLNTNIGGFAGNNSLSSFGLQTGSLSYQRDLFQIQNSGVELYKPKLTTSRNDVTTLILNVSNFGKEEYYAYANEHNLLSFFTNRLEDSDQTETSGWVMGDPTITELGTMTSLYVPSEYKFAFMTPLIPMKSPFMGNIGDYTVSAEFGMADPTLGPDGMNLGTEFSVPAGEPVYAVADGRVSQIGTDPEIGKYIEIEHVVPANTVITDTAGNRYHIVSLYSKYGNLQDPRVSMGDVISSNCSSNKNGGKCVSITQEISYTSSEDFHFEVYVLAKDLTTGELLEATPENSACDPYYWLTTKWSNGIRLIEGALGDPEIESMITKIKNEEPNLSPAREALIRNALTLVGKVKYFWGGGHEKVYMDGWDPEWGTYKTVWVGGHRTSGTSIPYGLDCSGFTRWAISNTLGYEPFKDWGGEYATVTYQWKATKNSQDAGVNGNGGKINVAKPTPGDFAAYGDFAHVGIYLYTDENGKKVYVHCSNGVEIGHASKFVKFFTPPGIY